MKIKSAFLFAGLLISGLIGNACDKRPFNYERALSEIIDSLNTDSQKLSIHIVKSEYILRIMADTVPVKEYPVVFGGNPVDDKLMQGDMCTPEGTFRMISKYPHQKWSKFIWISYPDDASREKHNRAKREKRIPADAKIGGEIGIHGVPEGMDYAIDLGINWTLGCISMKNKDVNEIYPYINKNTLIVIKK